jgi:hypothetical protein
MAVERTTSYDAEVSTRKCSDEPELFTRTPQAGIARAVLCLGVVVLAYAKRRTSYRNH